MTIKTLAKIGLRDVSFLIAVRIDTPDRLENLEIITRYLTTYFDTSVCIAEVDEQSLATGYIKANTQYIFEHCRAPVFHRTKINNRLIQSCTTKLAVLYDTDIIIPPEQLLASAQSIRQQQFHFALPYDGRFLQVDSYDKRIFKNCMDIDFLEGCTGLYATDTNYSVGGCFMFNVEEYKKCGMENENIEGKRQGDAERAKRLRKLEYPIFRPQGPMYHLWHTSSQNSYYFDEERAAKSFETYFKTCSIEKGELQKEISTWHWI